MNEVSKVEYRESWQEYTERLRDIRPEGFGPRRIEKDIDANIKTLREELDEIYVNNVYPAKEHRSDEPEMFLGSFGEEPLDPSAIHYIAMREADLPVRFQGKTTSAESDGIYWSRTVPTTGKSRRICLTWAHQSTVGEIHQLEHVAANEDPMGILIENTVANRSETGLLPQDLDPEHVNAETETRLGIPRDFHIELIESGHMSRFFLAQHVLNEHSEKTMKQAAKNEKLILRGKIPEYTHDAAPFHGLKLAYTYFRLRQHEKIKPISMKELLELQESVYRIGMAGYSTA